MQGFHPAKAFGIGGESGRSVRSEWLASRDEHWINAKVAEGYSRAMAIRSLAYWKLDHSGNQFPEQGIVNRAAAITRNLKRRPAKAGTPKLPWEKTDNKRAVDLLNPSGKKSRNGLSLDAIKIKILFAADGNTSKLRALAFLVNHPAEREGPGQVSLIISVQPLCPP
jgi:2-polyprenyl-6-methoxyphenol hydroxylase-like FAD-dependent oxidoreductase